MVNIRWAEMRDTQDLFDIYGTDGEKHQRSLNTYPILEWILTGDNVFLVAETSRTNRVGFIIARPKGEEASIDFFSVSKKSKAKGVRKMLLTEAERLLKGHRMSIYIPKKDKKKIKFYKDQGYELYDEMRNRYGPGKDAVYMFKDLRGKPKQVRVLQKKTRFKRAKILRENLEKLDEEIRD